MWPWSIIWCFIPEREILCHTKLEWRCDFILQDYHIIHIQLSHILTLTISLQHLTLNDCVTAPESWQWNLGLERGHVNTMHVHGFPCYDFMNLYINRTNIVWPCSETMTLSLLNLVLCLNMSYITNYNMSKASTHGTYITDDIMSKAFGHGPSVCNDTMFKASGHELYIYDHVIVRCLDMDI